MFLGGGLSAPCAPAGYILEGTELAFYIKKMAKKKSGKKE